MKNIFSYECIIGKLWIAESGGKICGVHFDGREPSGFEAAETDILREAAKQLTEYFNGERKEFDLPLAPVGTSFQQSVWSALLTIPYGETCSYKEIAEQVGSPKACRAVGMANNKNPIAVIVPCHRVCGHSGKLVGYAGGLDVKQQLLNLEKQDKS